MKKNPNFLLATFAVCISLSCEQPTQAPVAQTIVSETNISRDFFIDDSGKYLDTMNQNTVQYKLCHYVHHQGRTLAPDYYQTNCSEFLTVLLGKFYNLSIRDVRQINVNIKNPADAENFWFFVSNYSNNFGQELLKLNVSFPNNSHNELMMDNQVGHVVRIAKGAAWFVEENKVGHAVRIENATAGDIIQIWYPGSYGHCGVVKYVDRKHKKIVMYSSFPSTGGFGIQSFDYHENMLAFVARINKVEK